LDPLVFSTYEKAFDYLKTQLKYVPYPYPPYILEDPIVIDKWADVRIKNVQITQTTPYDYRFLISTIEVDKIVEDIPLDKWKNYIEKDISVSIVSVEEQIKILEDISSGSVPRGIFCCSPPLSNVITMYKDVCKNIPDWICKKYCKYLREAHINIFFTSAPKKVEYYILCQTVCKLKAMQRFYPYEMLEIVERMDLDFDSGDMFKIIN